MYSVVYKNFLYPFYEGFLRRRKTFVYLSNLEKNQWLPEDKLREIQWLRLKDIISHAYSNIPYYRRVFENEGIVPGDIKVPDDFRMIPFLTKKDIQNNEAMLVAKGYSGADMVRNETGGSTGEPIKFFYTRNSYEERVAASIRAKRWSGWDIGKKTTLIWGRYDSDKPFLKKLKFDFYNISMRKQLISAFSLSENNIAQQVKKINRFNPYLIESYVSSLYAIAEFVKRNKLSIVQPRAIITSAEMLYGYQRILIEDVFGCKIFNRYGCTEVMFIGAECNEHNGLHLGIDNVYIEFLRDNKPVKAGEIGEIVITDLTNFGMPLIRYKIGDFGVPSDRKCACGRSLPLMERVEGRTMDILLTKEGNFIQPQIFCYLFSRSLDWIRRYQIIQAKKGELTFRIVRGRDISESDTKEFFNKVVNAIKGSVNIHLDIVEEIPLTRSGKFKTIIAEVPIKVG